eukprot:SAG11_NODE_503_length_8890_cov_30.658628_5_plen_572_part_00
MARGNKGKGGGGKGGGGKGRWRNWSGGNGGGGQWWNHNPSWRHHQQADATHFAARQELMRELTAHRQGRTIRRIQRAVAGLANAANTPRTGADGDGGALHTPLTTAAAHAPITLSSSDDDDSDDDGDGLFDLLSESSGDAFEARRLANRRRKQRKRERKERKEREAAAAAQRAQLTSMQTHLDALNKKLATTSSSDADARPPAHDADELRHMRQPGFPSYPGHAVSPAYGAPGVPLPTMMPPPHGPPWQGWGQHAPPYAYEGPHQCIRHPTQHRPDGQCYPDLRHGTNTHNGTFRPPQHGPGMTGGDAASRPYNVPIAAQCRSCGYDGFGFASMAAAAGGHCPRCHGRELNVHCPDAAVPFHGQPPPPLDPQPDPGRRGTVRHDDRPRSDEPDANRRRMAGHHQRPRAPRPETRTHAHPRARASHPTVHDADAAPDDGGATHQADDEEANDDTRVQDEEQQDGDSSNDGASAGPAAADPPADGSTRSRRRRRAPSKVRSSPRPQRRQRRRTTQKGVRADNDEWEVEQIVGRRITETTLDPRVEYQVQWRHPDSGEEGAVTWEPSCSTTNVM